MWGQPLDQGMLRRRRKIDKVQYSRKAVHDYEQKVIFTRKMDNVQYTQKALCYYEEKVIFQTFCTELTILRNRDRCLIENWQCTKSSVSLLCHFHFITKRDKQTVGECENCMVTEDMFMNNDKDKTIIHIVNIEIPVKHCCEAIPK